MGNCNNSVSFANRTRRLHATGLVLSGWLLSGVAYADPNEGWSAACSPDGSSGSAGRGLYARLLVGPVYLALVGRGQPRRLQLSAASFGGTLALGRTLGRSGAVFAEAMFASSLDPRIQSSEGWAQRPGVSLTTVGLAAGGVYRLRGDPATVSMAVGLGQVRAVRRSAGALLGHTRWGPTVHLTFGRSWAVGRRLGAGLALRASVGRHGEGASTKDLPVYWLAFGFGLLLAATYD